MARRIPIAAARKDFAAVLRDSARGERIKLTRYDKTIAVVVSTDDLAKLMDCEGRRKDDRRPPTTRKRRTAR